jgi:hypothetical protein
MPRRKAKNANADKLDALKKVAQDLRNAGIDELSFRVEDYEISINKKSKWRLIRKAAEGILSIFSK